MGISSNGILFFGICPDTDDNSRPAFIEKMIENTGAEEFDEALEISFGIPQYPDPARDYTEAKEQLEKQCAVEEVLHCSYDYPIYAYAVRGTVSEASRGYPVELSELVTIPDRTDEFVKWFADQGEKVEPKWWLASVYG